MICGKILKHIAMLTTLLVSVDMYAQVGTEFEVDSIKYRITSENPHMKTVAVCGCDLHLWEANIPSTVTYKKSPTTFDYNCTYHVTEILPYSFQRFRLCKVYIPDGIKTIKRNVFGSAVNDEANETPLEFVSIGASVETIEDGAFDYCTNLAEFVVSPDNPNYDSRDDCKALIETATNIFVKGGVNSQIPTSVVAIAARAFSFNKRLGSVYIPENIKEIGEEVFFRCENLESAVIDGELLSIPNRTFRECIRLSTLKLPESLQVIGSEAFFECNSLQHVTIPDNVTTISDKAFGGVYFYNDNYEPSTLIEHKKIPNKMSSVSIGASVVTLDGAFDFCTNLTEVTVSPENPKYDSRDNCNCIIETATNTLVKGTGHSVVPVSVVSIAPRAFIRCHTLESITIPEGVKSIGENAFYECLGLKQMNYNAIDCAFDANQYYYAEYWFFKYDYDLLYQSFGEGAWSPFTYLQCRSFFEGPEAETSVYPVTVTIGPKVESLPSYLLNDQSSLTAVSLPPTLKSIGNYALANTSIESLSIPQNVQVIGAYAFWKTPLASIVLPNSLQILGDYALAATGIKRVSLPASVVSLGLGVFANAPLTRLISNREYPPYCAVDMGKGIHSLSNLDYDLCELCVPSGSVDIYRSAFPWNLFQNMVQIIEGPKSCDLNGDGVVDISDLNIVINWMLGKGDTNVTFVQADVSDDGNVDISDINMVINTMLGKD